jgi:hypothetical protein
MPQQTPAQARVINPILSTQARGYRQSDFVGGFLFPRVPVMARGGQVIEFGREAFRAYNTRRAPGSTTKRIQFGYQGKPYGIAINSIEVPVPRELQQDAAAVPGIDLGRRATMLGMRTLALGLEIEQATIAQLNTNYAASNKVALGAAARWNVSTGTPISDVTNWREAVRGQVGMNPNVLVMGPKVFAALKTNPTIIDRIKYTARDVVTTDVLAALFEVDRVVVGNGVTFNDAGAASDIWGKTCVLAYVPTSENGNVEEPSYGYTYTFEGHPLVEEPYWEPQSKSWIYPVSDDRQPVLTGIASGFLAETVVD